MTNGKKRLNNLGLREKTAVKGFIQKLKCLLKGNLVMVEMFGSKARGQADRESDIDILIVVKNKSVPLIDKIYDLLFNIDPYYEFKISLITYSYLEYKKNVELESPFIESLNKEGVKL